MIQPTCDKLAKRLADTIAKKLIDQYGSQAVCFTADIDYLTIASLLQEGIVGSKTPMVTAHRTVISDNGSSFELNYHIAIGDLQSVELASGYRVGAAKIFDDELRRLSTFGIGFSDAQNLVIELPVVQTLMGEVILTTRARFTARTRL